jgi:hypothetical protein
LNGGSDKTAGLNGGSDKAAGLKVAAGEGATGATSPQSTAVQEFAVAMHSTSAFPRAWHAGQQATTVQVAWRSSQVDPTSSCSESHEEAHSSKLVMKMHLVKSTLSTAHVAPMNGGKELSTLPADGVTGDGEDWPLATACNM